MKKIKLVIYGTGGLGREILVLLRAVQKTFETQKENCEKNYKEKENDSFDFIGFIDDNKPAGTQIGNKLNNEIVLGGIDWLTSRKPDDEHMAVAIGLANPSVKASLYEKLSKNSGIKFPILIHPTAIVDSSVSLAPGTIISAYCLVSVDANLGLCTFLNNAAQVGHDCVVDDFCSIMPSVNISGDVTIGQRTLIGVGAKILQGLKIGSDVTVSMGSVVLRNISDNCTVIGNPAKKI